MIFPPPGRTAAPEREAGARPAPLPQPLSPAGTKKNKRTRVSAPGRHTDRARRQQASTNRSGMGATLSMTRGTPRTPALLPAQGRQRVGMRQGDPSPHCPPRPRSPRARRKGRPPPPPHPPAQERTAPSQVGGNRDRAAPPPSTPNGARDWGRTRGGARTTWNGPTSAQYQDCVRCARQTNQGRGGGETDAAGARAHTHTNDTPRIPEGQLDQARGTHRPHGMAYQRARVRDTRMGRPATHSAGHVGREGGTGEDTTPGTGPSPPSRPRASRTHDQRTAPAKAVVAHCATPQRQGKAASAPAHGGPTGDKPVARARQRRRPG